MLQWDDQHPYNAVHVVRIPATLDSIRLRDAINHVLERHGLTRLIVDRSRGAFEYRGGPAGLVPETMEPSGDAISTLSTHIERELNTRFTYTEVFEPFRFFTVQTGGGFFLGLTYFHPVADAESIVRLMRDFAGAYSGEMGASKFELYPGNHDNLLRRPGLLARKLLALPSQAGSMRKSFRVWNRNLNDAQVGFRFLNLEAATLARLKQNAKAWDVTVNDLLLAVLLKSVSPMSPARRNARRSKLSVGCIVNTRRDLGVEREGTFGLFLGSFTVTHAVPDGISLADLAKDIRHQTSDIKSGRLYLGAPLEMGIGRLMLSLFSTERRKALYQKHYPLWGGITNMNLNQLWDQEKAEKPVDYFRAVSTGPVTPLVMSVTTVRDRVNIGLTHRQAIYPGKEMNEFTGRFVADLNQLTPS